MKIYSTVIILFLSIILGNYELKAQNDPTTVQSLSKIRITLVGFGLEREQKITKQSTLYLGISIDAVFPFEPDYKPNRSDALSLNSFIGLPPVIYTGFRKYYNLIQRAKNKRKTTNNSAEYFGLEVDAITPINSEEGEYKTLWTMSFSPQWGIQRSLSEKVNFEFTLGPAIKTNFETTKLLPFGRLGLSFLF
jgi:hypothetical protein